MNQDGTANNLSNPRSGASVNSITGLAYAHYPLFSITEIRVPHGWIIEDECKDLRRRLIGVRDSLIGNFPADIGTHRIIVVDKRPETPRRYMEELEASAGQKAEIASLIDELVTMGQCSAVFNASGLETRPLHVLVAEEGWVSGVELAQIFGDLASAS